MKILHWIQQGDSWRFKTGILKTLPVCVKILLCQGENTALLWKLKFLTSVSCPVDIRHLFMCRSQVAWKYQNDPWPGHCHFDSCSSSQHHLVHIAALVNVVQYYRTYELVLLNIEATQLCSPIINTKVDWQVVTDNTQIHHRIRLDCLSIETRWK